MSKFYIHCQEFCCISAVQANLSVEASPGTGWGNLVYSTAAGNLPFSPLVMSEALKFLRLCLDCSAGVTKEQRQRSQMLPAISVYLKELSSSTSGTNTHCVLDHPVGYLVMFLLNLYRFAVPTSVPGTFEASFGTCCRYGRQWTLFQWGSEVSTNWINTWKRDCAFMYTFTEKHVCFHVNMYVFM